MTSSDRQLDAIILAAGKGTRMNSDLPKVLHPVAGRPMIRWVIDACREVGCGRIVLIVGHRAETVRDELSDVSDLVFVEQTEQLGTGHAIMQPAHLYEDDQHAANTDLLVLCGDGPLIRRSTLQKLVRTHRTDVAAATLATSVLDDPTGYGRIIRDADGQFERIVEQKDASDAERSIGEVNPSYYCFRADDLFAALPRLSNDNAKGEYYITDVFGLLKQDGKRVSVVDAVPAEDVLSINTPEQQVQVDRILRQRMDMNGRTEGTPR